MVNRVVVTMGHFHYSSITGNSQHAEAIFKF